MVIEVKVKWLPELVLNPQVLGLIIERLGTPTMNLWHLATIIHHQMRHVTTSRIGCMLRLPNGWRRTVERNQPADPKMAWTGGRCHSVHIHSNSPTFLIEGFLSRIIDWHISKAGDKLLSCCTNQRGQTLGLSTMSTVTP